MADVLLVCEFPTLNGGERSLLSTLAGLREAGYQLSALAPPSGPLAEAFQAAGVRVEPLELQDATGTRLSQHALRERLAQTIDRLKPDLLHANSLAMSRLSGPVVADLRLPSIGHLRDIIRLSAASIADINRHTRLLAVSAATRNYHVNQGLSATKTHVLHNGVDLAAFQPVEATGWLQRELQLPPTAMLVGCIGQLVMRKGQDTLAAAAVELAARFPDVHYVFVGSRYSEKAEALEYETRLHQAFAVAKIAGRAHFLGCREDVARLLPELALLVHPARQEPLGRVLLEAAAAGVAIVATNVGGTTEIFPPEANAARLVPPGDSRQLSMALAQLLEQPELRRQLGARARARAEAAFSISTAAANLARHYREVLAG